MGGRMGVGAVDAESTRSPLKETRLVLLLRNIFRMLHFDPFDFWSSVAGSAPLYEQ